MTRNWHLGEPAWGWPDYVDKTGTHTVGGYRYLPIVNTAVDGQKWHVARVHVDEDDTEMLADARLLLAAPALKVALENLLEVVRMSDADTGGGCDEEKYNAAIKAANDAIAKAEGRTRDAVEN